MKKLTLDWASRKAKGVKCKRNLRFKLNVLSWFQCSGGSPICVLLCQEVLWWITKRSQGNASPKTPPTGIKLRLKMFVLTVVKKNSTPRIGGGLKCLNSFAFKQDNFGKNVSVERLSLAILITICVTWEHAINRKDRKVWPLIDLDCVKLISCLLEWWWVLQKIDN